MKDFKQFLEESVDVAKIYTSRETKDGVWHVFKKGSAVSQAGPFKSPEEAQKYIMSLAKKS